MIEVSSLAAVFVMECLAGAVLLIIGMTLWRIRRRARERNAAGEFITHVKDAEAGRSKILGKTISESCDLEPVRLEAVLSEINSRENSLYQEIVQMFLSRDADLLNGIDQSIQALNIPFCRLVSEVSEKSADNPELEAALESAEVEIHRLRKQSERLSDQLSMAMEMVDEISCEYTQIFGSSKEAEEIELSRNRLLNTYLRAEQRMTQAFTNH